jgi:hypothetical protein
VFKAQDIAGIDADTQEVRATACWDGLFSQNPPIKNFIYHIGDPAKKPAELALGYRLGACVVIRGWRSRFMHAVATGMGEPGMVSLVVLLTQD